MTFAKDWVQDWSRDWASNFDGSIYAPLMSLNNFGEFVKKPTPTATITNTRTGSGHAFFDHEGVYRETLAGEKVIDGARRARQMLADSSDMSAPSWTPANGAIVTADTIQFVNNNSRIRSGVMSAPTRGAFIVAVTVQGDATTFDLELVDNSDGSDSHTFEITASSTPTRYWVLMDNAASSTFSGNLAAYINRVGNKATPGTTVTLTDWMCEEVTAQASKIPSEPLDSDTDYGFGVNGVRYYATTNGNIVVGNTVIANTGSAITPTPELLAMPARTFHNTYNRDLTNAAWSATNITAVKDATGIDGKANSASTLTADANNGTIFYPLTLTSLERTAQYWVRRKTGSGTVEITDDGGSTY